MDHMDDIWGAFTETQAPFDKISDPYLDFKHPGNPDISIQAP